MTDRQFLEHMFELTTRLTDAVENDGYRSDAYNEVLKEIAECGSKFNLSRQRHFWLPAIIISFLLALLALIAGSILW